MDIETAHGLLNEIISFQFIDDQLKSEMFQNLLLSNNTDETIKILICAEASDEIKTILLKRLTTENVEHILMSSKAYVIQNFFEQPTAVTEKIKIMASLLQTKKIPKKSNPDPEGDSEEDTVGNPVGNPVGDTEGDTEEDTEGNPVGNPVGDPEGDSEEDTEGNPVGNPVGEKIKVCSVGYGNSSKQQQTFITDTDISLKANTSGIMQLLKKLPFVGGGGEEDPYYPEEFGRDYSSDSGEVDPEKSEESEHNSSEGDDSDDSGEVDPDGDKSSEGDDSDDSGEVDPDGDKSSEGDDSGDSGDSGEVDPEDSEESGDKSYIKSPQNNPFFQHLPKVKEEPRDLFANYDSGDDEFS